MCETKKTVPKVYDYCIVVSNEHFKKIAKQIYLIQYHCCFSHIPSFDWWWTRIAFFSPHWSLTTWSCGQKQESIIHHTQLSVHIMYYTTVHFENMLVCCLVWYLKIYIQMYSHICLIMWYWLKSYWLLAYVIQYIIGNLFLP